MRKLSINESFRITKPIAWFLNKVMLGEERIISNKDGPKIDLIIDDAYTSYL